MHRKDFLDIELVTTGKSGMKIPVSAVTENEFYEIPGLTLQKVVTAVIRDLYVRNMIMVIL